MSKDSLGLPDNAAERIRRADAVFDAALDLAPADRASFLDAACAHDPDLRADVQTLLRAHEDSATFFDAPAVAFAAPLLHAADLCLRHSPAQACQTASARSGSCARLGAAAWARSFSPSATTDISSNASRSSSCDTSALSTSSRGFSRSGTSWRCSSIRTSHACSTAASTGDGVPCFAMEYVEGEPIDRYCDDRALSIHARLALFERVCDAVQYAHRTLSFIATSSRRTSLVEPRTGSSNAARFRRGEAPGPIRTPEDVTSDRRTCG